VGEMLTTGIIFPIPTIDELLDEMGGATVFSKLDLTTRSASKKEMKERLHFALMMGILISGNVIQAYKCSPNLPSFDK